MSNLSDGAADVFFALGDDTRLSVVRRLGGGEALSATSLTDGARVTRQAIAKHLRVLEDARLVRHERRGREVLYTLVPERLTDARLYLDAVSRQWDLALARLRTFVEEPRGERRPVSSEPEAASPVAPAPRRRGHRHRPR
jgi:DNA-binding transcriptional ArsR family regulator